jgi:hypothetical protein
VLRKAPLHPHPDAPSPDIKIGTYCHVTPQGLAQIGFVLSGAIDQIELPDAVPEPQRRDGLWCHTCFEAFFRNENDDRYHELNFAPNGDWAAYRFTDYRAGMANDPDASAPELRIEVNDFGRVYWVRFSAPWLLDPRPFAVGLTAVIVDRSGQTSYWAIAHPPGKPDFHHRDCFARILPAPSGA